MPVGDVGSRSPDSAARFGAVYTPAPIAAWLAREVVHRLPAGARCTVIDPACGDGALLAAVADHDVDINLVGLDIDLRAVAGARERLGGNACITAADALAEPWPVTPPAVYGLIANPPWGAEVAHSRPELSAAGYLLASGQFDSYDLFVERAISQLPAGSVAGFLLPDSLLLPEHEKLRRLVIERTRLELVVRLGEGVFADVYRGTIAVVFGTDPPPPTHVVRCCRIRDSERRLVLSGMLSLAAVVRRDGHDVRQARFAENGAIDVDVTEKEHRTITRMAEKPAVWGSWLRSFRGVEIGKSGLVTVCSRCQNARPIRRDVDRNTACRSCGAEDTGSTVALIRPLSTSTPDWRPVLAGEDVLRYEMTLRRQIRVGIPGIRYKDPAIFAPPKLLVRKTGVGLHATLDETGALTTQTVFSFLPTHDAPEFALRYVLGVLNSRIMLAYHLKRHGDVEWRSHPYVTPKLLAGLPVPLPTPDTQGWRQAAAIADAVQDMLAAPSQDSRDHDLHIERQVAALFDCDAAECDWVDDVLGQAQQLQPIAALRLRPTDELYPLRVD